MTKYRIVRKKHTLNSYMVQYKFLGLFWCTEIGYELHYSLEQCKYLAEKLINEERIRKENPKHIVVKEY